MHEKDDLGRGSDASAGCGAGGEWLPVDRTTSKECRSYFQQSYIDQARALPLKGMGDDYCGCVKDALARNPEAADVTRMCSLIVNSRFQTASQAVKTPDN